MSAFVHDSTALAEADAQADAKALAEGMAEMGLASAAERLAASRERMREWMLNADGRQDRRRRAAEAAAGGRPPPWMDRLRELPVIGVLIDVLSTWWNSHPLHPVATLTQGVVRDTVAPIARRHPMAIVAGAFLVGVLLVRFRPWRWLLKPALFAGLTTQLITRLVASMPFESILDSMTSFTGPRRDARDEPAAAEAAAAPAAQAPPVVETETF